MQEDVKIRGKKLVDDFGWDKDLTKKIWCFGPDTMGPNMLLDATKAVQYLSEIKDSCVGAFQWASKEGVMAEEVRCRRPAAARRALQMCTLFCASGASRRVFLVVSSHSSVWHKRARGTGQGW